MSKGSDNFSKIRITNDILSTVASFKAIVKPGRARPTLDIEAHKALVYKKYDNASKIDDHITIFRVRDKKNLPPQEKKYHTVQGPEWTPPSSVGFVMGAQSKGLRIWFATKPTKDTYGLLGNNGEPSILARESMVAFKLGWMAREPQKHEKYGNTARAPVIVLTPPSSPRYASIEELKSIMNVNADWNTLPISLKNLIKLSTPVPKKLTDCLKKSRLTWEDLDDELATIVQTKDVLRLINEDSLSLAELNKAPSGVVRKLLGEREIIVLLADGEMQFDKLMEIYYEYIDGSDNYIGEFSFRELYNLLAGDQKKLSKLLLGLDLSINDIIKLYNDDYDMFCAFANDTAISFFKEYGDQIDIEKMAAIYRENLDLFYALINDETNVLHDINVEEFIDKYEQAQFKINKILEDGSYYGAYDAYDYVKSWVAEDGCPDEFLRDNHSSNDGSYYTDDCYEDQGSADTDEDSASYLAERFDGFNLLDEDSQEEEDCDRLTYDASDDTSVEFGGLSSGYKSDDE